jgi:crotonobetainyl-CoA:carnitine CoA-transferase CaiB-like acyl-CoA transferase
VQHDALFSEPSPGSKASLSVQHFRDEARRIREVAVHFTNTEIREQMLDIAAQYDVLAESVERRSPWIKAGA